MSSCGCNQSTCGCCEGVKIATPAATTNRPGLTALHYRAGIHGEFFESMKARLSTMTVDAPGADGQTIETFRPLTGLTTREPSDTSIALLDGWATVGDVLTFYQERIANEGYLRTATERRSVLELARLTGYALRPGVASTVYVAYTVDDNQVDPVEIPIGSRSQSVPAPGEQPQSFETAEKVVARREWNNLQVRLKRPQNITFTTVLTLSQIYVGGIATGLKAGDKLLFEFENRQYAIRVVKSITGEFTDNRTLIRLQPLAAGTTACLSVLEDFLAKAALIVNNQSGQGDKDAVVSAAQIYNDTLLGLYSKPDTWPSRLRDFEGGVSTAMDALVSDVEDQIAKILKDSTNPSPGVVTDPSKFVGPLLRPNVQQFRSTAQLPRTLGSAFAFGADSSPQLLVNFEPRLKDTYYKAWSSANVSTATPKLLAVHALRVSASLFGSTVQRMAEFDTANKLKTPDLWKEWPLDSTERTDHAFLDQIYDSIAPGSLAVIQSTSFGDTRR
ncbi:MAG: putative baseplate assembly protein, partial [Bryobacteraceae bacterium]